MKALNVFGLRIAGITAALLVLLFGLYWGVKTLLIGRDASVPVQISDAQRTLDRDSDGIADLYEGRFYRTNPTQSDTDNDGTSDLDEILAGRNPIVAGDNDLIKPPTGEQVTAQETYTQRYLAQLPTDVSRDEILDQGRIQAFVEANRGVLLPTLAPDALQATTASGKDAIGDYLDSVSSAHTKDLVAVTSQDIEAAFRLLVNTGDPAPLDDLLATLEQNVLVLRSVRAPQEVADLHRTFVAASQALVINVRLLRQTNTDFVGALVGARNIEDLGSVFQDIAAQMQALEGTYELE